MVEEVEVELVVAVVEEAGVAAAASHLVVPLDDVVGSDLELVDAERRRRVEHELRAARHVGLRLRLAVEGAALLRRQRVEEGGVHQAVLEVAAEVLHLFLDLAAALHRGGGGGGEAEAVVVVVVVVVWRQVEVEVVEVVVAVVEVVTCSWC